MTRQKKWIIGIGGVSLFGLVLISVVLVISSGGRRRMLEITGIIQATEVNLSARISEQIRAIPYREGDRVPAGAVAVRLEDREIRAEVLAARADLERARAAATEALRQRDRMARLFAEGVASPADRDSAETRDALAQAEARQREATLARVEARLADAVILSPLSGVVTLRAFEPGEVATPGATILTLMDLEHLWARADLDETLAARVRLGDPARVRAVGLPGREFTGRVVEIGGEGEFATQREVRRGRQDIRTFRVKVAVEKPDGLLKPGMTVTVLIASPPPSP